MPLFGNQRKRPEKKREVDSSVTDNAQRLEKLAEVDDDQLKADITIDNLALAFDKNDRVQEISDAIADGNDDVFIPIPAASIDPSVETYQVRSALLRNYQAESENATVVRWPLFKRIVDNAVARQESVVEYMTNLGDFNDQLNEINVGNLYSLLNKDVKIDQFIKGDDGKEDAKDQLWAQAGVAFLSFLLMSQFHKLSAMFTGDEEVKDKRAEKGAPVSKITGITWTDSEGKTQTANNIQQSPAPEAQEAQQEAEKQIDIVKILTKIAEAVVLFALIHGLSKKQARVLAQQVQPDDVSPELQEEYIERVSEVYDNPPEELSQLILTEDTDDEVIFEYCMAHIKANKEQKNFTPWITYAISRVREIQMTDLATSLDGTSNESDKIKEIIDKEGLSTNYSPPAASYERELMRYEVPPGYGYKDVARERPDTFFEIPTLVGNDSPISKYTPGRNEKLGFDLSNYIHDINNYSARAGSTSDYFMGLMQNNKYTPELVCCLLKFLADDLSFLKNLRNVLGLFGNGFKFDWGSLLEDITNGLFGDLRSKILSFALMEITKFMAKIKKPILEWIDRLETEEEYIAFCTPIIDMARVLLQIINEFERLLKDLAREIIDSLLTFELKVDNGIIEMHGTTRYVNIMAILDAIIFALENGQLCDQDQLAPADIHPDALPIIDRLSSQPDERIQQTIAEAQAFGDALEDQGAINGDTKVVQGFQDPDDPDLRMPISLDRTNDGESTIEAIERYSKNCGAYKQKAADLLKGLV